MTKQNSDDVENTNNVKSTKTWENPTLNNIVKKFGKGIVQTGQSLIETPKTIIPVSPAINIILGGGIPEGSYVILTGNPKCGKTVMALQFSANAQKDGRPIYYFNIEGRLKSRDLAGINGLKADDVIIIGSSSGKILTAEEYLQIAEDIINNVPRAVLILDSVSQLCTEKELTSDMGDMGRNPQAILMGKFCRKISNVLPVNNTVVIAITHLIANTSGYGASSYESGGRKIAYAVDVKMRAKRVEKWTIGASQAAEPIGQKVTWETESTSLVAPGRKIESYIRYGTGIDAEMELIDIGVNLGFIRKGGAWYYCEFLDNETDESLKFQGRDKLVNYLKTNNEHRTVLEQKILELTT